MTGEKDNWQKMPLCVGSRPPLLTYGGHPAQLATSRTCNCLIPDGKLEKACCRRESMHLKIPLARSKRVTALTMTRARHLTINQALWLLMMSRAQ